MAHHIFVLTVNAATDEVTVSPPQARLAAGDTVAFASANGRAQAKLRPTSKFSRPEFHAGDAPVAVLTDESYHAPCGVDLGAKVAGWPENEKFGPADRPPDQGGGGGGNGGNGGGD